MRKPHKHAEVIKAWADGAQIQTRDPSFSNPTWTNCNPDRISWDLDYEYRVKPTPIVRFAPVMKTPKQRLVQGYGVTSLECAKKQGDEHHVLLGVLRIEFDPDTGNLIRAQQT